MSELKNYGNETSLKRLPFEVKIENEFHSYRYWHLAQIRFASLASYTKIANKLNKYIVDFVKCCLMTCGSCENDERELLHIRARMWPRSLSSSG